MKIFETHAHYDDEAFDKDREDILSQMKKSGIDKIVNIGASIESSKYTVSLAEKYDFIYGAVGVHPSETDGMTEDDIKLIRDMTKHDKVKAIGEIGLDYHYDGTDRDNQKKWFIRQLELARELKLPVVIHSRDAAQDTIDIMKSEDAASIGGVVHCYSYSREIAKTFLNMGFYFGIGGVITFKNGKKLKETVKYLPIDKIVLETDSPYLAPEPHRGHRNSSLYLPYVVSEIAGIKDISEEEVAEITYKNAMNLYRMNEA